MMPLISVIIPVYNVDKYLEFCVNSVIAQTYSHLEIILVDDGSTDASGKLCDQYGECDKRIKIIHKPNGGLSDARNAGMKCATGEFIIFLDGDDWIESELVDRVLQTQKKTSAEIIVWGYYADFIDCHGKLCNSVKHTVPDIVCYKNGKARIMLENETLGIIGYAWNKMYPRQFIKSHSLCFPFGISLVEDIFFNKEALSKSNSIAFMAYPGTHYMQRPRTTLGTKFYPNYFQLKFDACIARISILKNFMLPEASIYNVKRQLQWNALWSAIRAINRSNLSKKDKCIEMKKLLNQKSCQDILNEFQPHSLKERFGVLLIRSKQMFLFNYLWRI